MAAAILLLAGLALWATSRENTLAAIKDFNGCVEAGYSVRGSGPAQCLTPDGKLFVEGVITESGLIAATGTVQGSVSGGTVCTLDAKECPDGSYVGRVGPSCEFAACPKANSKACTLEAKLCPDGSYVGRVGPNCEFASCPSVNNTTTIRGSGTLEGNVNIGPLCPVEPCNYQGPNPYTSRQIILKSQGRADIAIQLKADGSFSAQVPAGTYSLNLSDCGFMGCHWTLPKIVKVEANGKTQVNLDIDTGIR